MPHVNVLVGCRVQPMNNMLCRNSIVLALTQRRSPHEGQTTRGGGGAGGDEVGDIRTEVGMTHWELVVRAAAVPACIMYRQITILSAESVQEPPG
jgi:hypothetical protein